MLHNPQTLKCGGLTVHIQKLFDLTGNVALVTGGGTGLGKQMAIALAEAGADVAIAARRLQFCEDTAQELRQLGVKALPLQMDVTESTQVETAIRSIIEAFGQLDILINNAGTFDFEPAENESRQEWDRVQQVNLTGAFVCAQVAGRQMIKQGGGRIIQISSIYGETGMDGRLYSKDPHSLPATVSFAASKGGLINLTRALATAWAHHGIRVNTISPGGFPLEVNKDSFDPGTQENFLTRVPLGRWGGQDDLKGAIVYLASRASDYVTGTNLVVDGGYLSW